MDLKFDKMDVDTTLAQDYLKKEILLQKWDTSELLYYNGKILGKLTDFPPTKQYPEISSNLHKLSILLKQNINLFAQLEYLNRKIPIEDTKVQMYLIIQQLIYLANCNINETVCRKADIHYGTEYFVMKDTTYILQLGFIVRAFVYSDSVPVIIVDKDAKAICYLFAQLCLQTGIKVLARYTDADKPFCVNGIHFPGNETHGSVGVVSESSDVDSAVDVFLTSSKQVPWRLQRVLVQENVYEQFKTALTWKCNLNKPGDVTSDTLLFNDRAFLIDAVGNSNLQPSDVVVEAYRTRKELLSLLNQNRPHYVSLWANDIAEINEISHSILSQVVWVNSFANFRGPPWISEAIYTTRSDNVGRGNDLSSTEITQLFELQKSWLKLSTITRYETLCKVVGEKFAEQPENVFYSELKNMLKEPLYPAGTYVDVDKDYVCLGVPVASDKIHIHCLTINSFFNKAFLKELLHGNAFVLKDGSPELLALIDSLKKSGVPITAGSYHNDNPLSTYIYTAKMFNLDHITKVIWTNSGTIFAN